MFETKKMTVHRADGSREEIKLNMRFAVNRRLDWAMRAVAAEKSNSPDRYIYQSEAFKPSALDF
jgi:hypothetical protein